MRWNPTPHTWMHRNHHHSGKCTGISPLTHECTEILTPQVNAPKSYSSWWWMLFNQSSLCGVGVRCIYLRRSHMNALKSLSLKQMHRSPTPHTWIHRNHHSSGKCTEILHLTHEWIKIVTPQANARESYPSHTISLKCTSVGLLTRLCVWHKCQINRSYAHAAGEL